MKEFIFAKKSYSCLFVLSLSLGQVAYKHIWELAHSSTAGHCVNTPVTFCHRATFRKDTVKKSFSCSQCPKSFTLWNDLQTHLRKPLSCDQCRKYFTQIGELNYIQMPFLILQSCFLIQPNCRGMLNFTPTQNLYLSHVLSFMHRRRILCNLQSPLYF